MRVLYLFTGTRTKALELVKRGEDLGNGFWGMLGLYKFGVDATFVELEQYLPDWLCRFLRKYIVNSYFAHIPFFPIFFKYDVIYTSGAYGSQLIHALLGIKKPKWVMFDFSIMGMLGSEKTIKQKIFAYMVSRAGGIVTLDRLEADRLKKRFPSLAEKIEFVPYGLDINFFSPISDEPEIEQIFVPGTDPDRDYKTLFAACEDLPVTIRFTTYETRLRSLGNLPSNVIHKRLTLDEMRREYARSKIVAIPLNTKSGLNDAMGVSVLQEAMSMGKAIVASNTSAMASYVENGKSGLLVKEGDVQEMRNAIIKLLNDDRYRKSLGQEARRFAELNLDTNYCTGNLASFFKKITSF